MNKRFKYLFLLLALGLSSGCSMNQDALHLPDFSLNMPSLSNPLHFPLSPDKRVKPCLERVLPSGAQDGGILKMLYPDDPALKGLPLGPFQCPFVLNQGAAQRYPLEEGICSAYSQSRGVTASEQPFNPKLLTAAHKTLPFGTVVRCSRKDTGESVLAVINDRGPFVKGRIIDLSQAAGRAIHMLEDGLIKCTVEVVAYPCAQ